MSLKMQTLIEIPRGTARSPWTERVELLEFYGRLQLCSMQVLGSDLPPVEIWISADCDDGLEVAEAITAWALARAGTAAQAEDLCRRAAATLSSWNRDATDLWPATAADTAARAGQA